MEFKNLLILTQRDPFIHCFTPHAMIAIISPASHCELVSPHIRPNRSAFRGDNPSLKRLITPFPFRFPKLLGTDKYHDQSKRTISSLLDVSIASAVANKCGLGYSQDARVGDKLDLTHDPSTISLPNLPKEIDHITSSPPDACRCDEQTLQSSHNSRDIRILRKYSKIAFLGKHELIFTRNTVRHRCYKVCMGKHS